MSPWSWPHLRDALGIKGVKRVALHEPLTGLLRVTTVIVEKGMPRMEVWRALQGAASFKGDCGKICIAVNDDIDPDNADAILWALAYRANPVEDVETLRHRGQGHGPRREQGGDDDPTLLIDATMKGDMPPSACRSANSWSAPGRSGTSSACPPLQPSRRGTASSLGDLAARMGRGGERAVRAATPRTAASASRSAAPASSPRPNPAHGGQAQARRRSTKSAPSPCPSIAKGRNDSRP